MKHSFSIRTAILIPFLSIIIAMIIILSIMINRTYDDLALEQGSKLMTTMEQTAEDKLISLLEEPHLVNILYGSLIELNEYYKLEDYRILEPITLSLMENIASSLPHVSSIGYGDYHKNFLGIRKNEDSSFTLMVKDKMTDSLLNIYAGDNRNTEVLAFYEDYDPTTRPWYQPAIVNPIPQWSEIYVNYDEIQNSTITSIVPILDKNGQVMSVTGIDVTLNGINDFLKEITETSKGTIYLVDHDFRVIAHSTDELMVDTLDTDPPTSEFSYGMDSENFLIASSAAYFNENRKTDQVKYIESEKEKYYTLYSHIDASLGLDWYFIVSISEDDLIGNIKSEFSFMRLMLILLGAIGLVIGIFVVSVFISSVTRMASAFSSVKMENLNAHLFAIHDADFKEIKVLKKAYKTMLNDLKASFNSLRKSERRYKSLIENSDALIFSMTKAGEMLTINSQVEYYSGIKSDELEGVSFYDMFLDDASKDLWKRNIEKAVLNQENVDGIYEYIDRQDQRVIFKIKIIPVTTEDSVDLLIATLVNIVELVEAQEEVSNLMEKEKNELEILVAERTQALEMAMEELIQKEKLASLGSLVSGISHEVNTPLGVAVSASSYLKNSVQKNKDKLLQGQMTKTQFVNFIEKLNDSVIIIEKNLMRADSLIKSFKQISVNRTYVEITEFKILEYLNSTITSLHHELKKQGHQVHVTCPENIKLYGDPGSFSQIITNFILNSITHAYTDESGHFTIDVKEEKDEVILVYKDDGKGISEEVIHRIFDPFFTTNRTQGGSGLGLNIVYNIITGQFDGSITVDSDAGGTSFTCIFPKKEA